MATLPPLARQELWRSRLDDAGSVEMPVIRSGVGDVDKERGTREWAPAVTIKRHLWVSLAHRARVDKLNGKVYNCKSGFDDI